MVFPRGRIQTTHLQHKGDVRIEIRNLHRQHVGTEQGIVCRTEDKGRKPELPGSMSSSERRTPNNNQQHQHQDPTVTELQNTKSDLLVEMQVVTTSVTSEKRPKKFQ